MSKPEAPPNKPSLPEGYQVPDVWTFQEPQGGPMGAMNRPTAGARFDEELRKGEHPYQLYSLGTPNGQKVTILLEELNDIKKVEYDAWFINIMELKQFSSGFVEVNPNSKIPCMLDVSASPPIRLFESGSILMYIAEKEGHFIPSDPAGRAECMNWLFWQMGSAPFLGGGFGHFFHYAPVRIEYAIDRYTMEVKRQLDVLDKHLADKDYICGADYTIADMAIYPWMKAIPNFYTGPPRGDDFLSFYSYKNLNKWIQRIEERPAVQRGMRVNGFGPTAVKERHSAADFDVKPEGEAKPV